MYMRKCNTHKTHVLYSGNLVLLVGTFFLFRLLRKKTRRAPLSIKMRLKHKLKPNALVFVVFLFIIFLFQFNFRFNGFPSVCVCECLRLFSIISVVFTFYYCLRNRKAVQLSGLLDWLLQIYSLARVIWPQRQQQIMSSLQ